VNALGACGGARPEAVDRPAGSLDEEDVARAGRQVGGPRAEVGAVAAEDEVVADVLRADRLLRAVPVMFMTVPLLLTGAVEVRSWNSRTPA
jgi:hypothetical protein